MGIRIKFDNSNNVIPPTFVLSSKGGNKIGVIPATNIQYSDNLNGYDELSFKVYKNSCVSNEIWDQLKDFKLVWAREYDTWFEIQVELNDENDIVKNISAKSLGECELSQVILYDIQINTEEDIQRDDYEPTVLYDQSNKNKSLLDRITEKAPHYKVGHVDSSLKNIQRTFEFSGTSIYDAFQEIAQELNCIFIINNGSTSEGKPKREINVYDLESYCIECGHRSEFLDKCPNCGSENILTGYGEDTTVFISKDNLADDVTYSTDVESVKNCFRLEAGDDLMTAAIASCNPSGSNYIWYISDEMKSDMSDDLQRKLKEYDELFEYYQNEYSINLENNLVNQYNLLVDKYSTDKNQIKKIPSYIKGYSNLTTLYYETIDFLIYLQSVMMPNIDLPESTSLTEVAKINSLNMKSISVLDLNKASASTVNSTITSYVRNIINSSKFQVRLNESTYVDNIWRGTITVTSYSNEEDTATTALLTIHVNDNYEEYVSQQLKTTLDKSSDETTDISGLFNLSVGGFEAEIKKYCLSMLVLFQNCCESCLNILIEQGIANKSKYLSSDNDLYNKLYIPYYEKNNLLKDEIKLRESEIEIIAGTTNADGRTITRGVQSYIINYQLNIQNTLNFESFLGDLLEEFSAYRREDTFSNDNYISDGLSNNELFKNALEFIDIAKKEIYKSSTLQHVITSSLKNLLVMPEFSPIVDYFKVGNWIRFEIDKNIYLLRIISYEVDYENLDNINITFSDIKKVRDGISDLESILNQSSAIAGSYGYVKRQVNKNKKGNELLREWVDKGLSLTKTKIIDNADNQNITFDEHGVLCREYLPLTDNYDDCQLKIINKGLYLTDDNWLSSRAGIGNFTFYNPKTGVIEEDYGVIANTLVGSLVLSEEVGVYTENGNVMIDNRGITIISDGINSETEHQTVFSIMKKVEDSNNEITYDPICYINDGGDFVLNGSIKILPDKDEDSAEFLNDLVKRERFENIVMESLNPEVDNLNRIIDDKYNELHDFADTLLKDYKDEVAQYMQFDSKNGLTISAVGSDFSTNIRNDGMWFIQKEGDTEIGVAYIMNKLLYIPNAQITSSFILGKFFFSPRGDGSMSITWQE